MYMLYWKEPTAIHDGKSGYVMSWRGKQVAMCEEIKPLEDYISKLPKQHRANYYIERMAI